MDKRKNRRLMTGKKNTQNKKILAIKDIISTHTRPTNSPITYL